MLMNYTDFMKSRSKWNWHKDIHQQDFLMVGNFDLNFTDDISACKSTALDWRWKDLETLDIADDIGPLEKPINIKKIAESLDENSPVNLYRSNPTRTPNIKTMIESLGMRNTNVRFLNQSPGRMTNLHVDTFYEKKIDGSFGSLERDLDKVCRFIVMMSDWEFGQVSIFGNSVWSHWKAGDTIKFSASDVPHAAANTGWCERNSLVLTGFITDKTETILKNAMINPIQKLN